MNLAKHQDKQQNLDHFFHHPLEYIQNMTMTLSQIENSEELQTHIEDFLKPETFTFIENNHQLMLILGYIWNNTIRRVVFSPSDIRFPNLLLLFPPVYHQLAWTDEENTEWNEVHEETLKRFESDNSYDDAIMLLFLEGMRYSLYDAMLMFKSRHALLKTKTDRQQARALEWELQHYGWPSVELRYLA